MKLTNTMKRARSISKRTKSLKDPKIQQTKLRDEKRIKDQLLSLGKGKQKLKRYSLGTERYRAKTDRMLAKAEVIKAKQKAKQTAYRTSAAAASIVGATNNFRDNSNIASNNELVNAGMSQSTRGRDEENDNDNSLSNFGNFFR